MVVQALAGEFKQPTGNQAWQLKVKDGEKVFFWENSWVNESPLKSISFS